MSKTVHTVNSDQLADLVSLDADINLLMQQKAAYLRAIKSGLSLDETKTFTWTKEYSLVEVPSIKKP